MSYGSIGGGVEVSWSPNTEIKGFNWMEFDRPKVKVTGTYNYKLMVSKSKVGKRKVLVRLIGETKCKN